MPEHGDERGREMADEIQFWHSGEWTMVYLNGELVEHGDHYHADEWLQQRFGVIVVDDVVGASVPDGHQPVRLLAEAEENQRTAAEVRAAAQAKREQAQKLIAEADSMEAGR